MTTAPAPAAFARFNRQWMEPVVPHLAEGGLLATFIDWRSVELLIASGRELGLDLINVVVWVKTMAAKDHCGAPGTSSCRCSRRAASRTSTMSNLVGTAAGGQTSGNTPGRPATGRIPATGWRSTRP